MDVIMKHPPYQTLQLINPPQTQSVGRKGNQRQPFLLSPNILRFQKNWLVNMVSEFSLAGLEFDFTWLPIFSEFIKHTKTSYAQKDERSWSTLDP